MTDVRQQFRREENSRQQRSPHAEYRSWAHQLLSESDDFETVLRTTESRPSVEPSVEQWEQFGERVMEKIHEASRRRLTLRERWQVFLDRCRASDSRLKPKGRVAVTVGACILLAVALYLLVQRFFPRVF